MHTIATAVPAPAVETEPSAAPVRVPWHVHAVLFASASVVLGVLWDISWHQSVGRDTLFSPPHLAIYLGGVVAGLACGWHVLRTSFAGTDADRAAAVTFWKYFRGSFGAWLCIWGAIAMITSAPFDDWWHNAYGLDVKILSPPHTVLALGILAIQLGAMFMVLALQNRADTDPGGDPRLARTFRWMFALAASLVIANFVVMTSEYGFKTLQHGTLFYQVSAGILPLALAAIAIAGRLRWPATAAAALYVASVMALIWILPLFPAEPRLAPVRFPIDRMMPPQFPLMLIVPAFAMDLVMRGWGGRARGWLLAAALAAAFLVPFFAVQWHLSEFLLSDAARNPVFGQHLRPYFVGEMALSVRGEFYRPASPEELARGMPVALLLAIVSARVGLAAGGWMARVRR